MKRPGIARKAIRVMERRMVHTDAVEFRDLFRYYDRPPRITHASTVGRTGEYAYLLLNAEYCVYFRASELSAAGRKIAQQAMKKRLKAACMRSKGAKI